MNSSRQWNQEWQRNPIGRCVAGRLDADGTGVVVVVVVVQVLAVLGPARQSGVHAMWPPVLLGLCPPLAADETRVPAVPRERPTVARRTPPQLPIDPPPRTPPPHSHSRGWVCKWTGRATETCPGMSSATSLYAPPPPVDWVKLIVDFYFIR